MTMKEIKWVREVWGDHGYCMLKGSCKFSLNMHLTLDEGWGDNYRDLRGQHSRQRE